MHLNFKALRTIHVFLKDMTNLKIKKKLFIRKENRKIQINQIRKFDQLSLVIALRYDINKISISKYCKNKKKRIKSKKQE